MDNRGNISIINDNSRDIAECIVQRGLSRFNACASGLNIKDINYNNLLNKLQELYDINVEFYEISKTNKMFYWTDKKDSFCIVGSYSKEFIYLDVFAISTSLNHFLFTVIKEFIDISNEADIIINNVTIGAQGINQNYRTFDRKQLEDISYKFYPYIDVEEMFLQFTKYNENILCLLGKSGLGKTALISCYLKFMTENPDLFLKKELEIDDFNIMYIKSEDVLSSDSFWSNLETSYYNLIVLDDLDYFLGTRNVVESGEDLQKIKFISNLLSYTDGIQESDTKIIITTNREVKDIDDAILRKGRMFDVIELRKLYNDEALDVWLSYDLKEELFFEIFGDCHEILAADLGSEINKITVDKSTLRKSYMKEDGISIMKNYSRKKSVGF